MTKETEDKIQLAFKMYAAAELLGLLTPYATDMMAKLKQHKEYPKYARRYANYVVEGITASTRR